MKCDMHSGHFEKLLHNVTQFHLKNACFYLKQDIKCYLTKS